METLSVEDIMKLASKSSKARDLILGLAKTAANDSGTEFNEDSPSMNEDESGSEESNKEEKKVEEQAPVEQPVAEAPVAVPNAAPAPTMGPEDIGAKAAQSFLGPDVMQAAMAGDPNAANIVARTAGHVAGAVAEAAANAGAGAPDPAMDPAMDPAAQGMEVPGDPAAMPAEGAPVDPNAPPVDPNAPPVAPEAAAGTPEQQVADSIVPQGEAAPAAPVGVQDPGKADQTQVAPGNPAGPVPAAGPGEPAPVAAPVAAPGAAPAPEGTADLATVAKLIQLAKAGQI